MLIVGYVFAIRSERRLCAEVPADHLVRQIDGVLHIGGFASSASRTDTRPFGVQPRPP
jgi:hypothetical protein